MSWQVLEVVSEQGVIALPLSQVQMFATIPQSRVKSRAPRGISVMVGEEDLLFDLNYETFMYGWRKAWDNGHYRIFERGAEELRDKVRQERAEEASEL